jgi:nucleoid-associated protein YgaU
MAQPAGPAQGRVSQPGAQPRRPSRPAGPLPASGAGPAAPRPLRWAGLAGLAIGLVAAPAGLLGPGPLAGPGSPLAGAAPATRYYTVRPGDTLWSIAERLHPGSDPRPVVAEMEAALPPGPLVPGERVAVSP